MRQTRQWSPFLLAAIAKAIGVCESKLAHSKAKFVKLTGLDAGGAIQFQRLSAKRSV
jgi:hypothetical protein